MAAARLPVSPDRHFLLQYSHIFPFFAEFASKLHRETNTVTAFPGAQADSPVLSGLQERYHSARGGGSLKVWGASVVLSEQPPALAGYPGSSDRLGIGSFSLWAK